MSHVEIARTDEEQPYQARIVADNGAVLWTTKQYARRTSALSAVAAIANMFGVAMSRPPAEDPADESGSRVIGVPRLLPGEPHSFDVRDVDERAS